MKTMCMVATHPKRALCNESADPRDPHHVFVRLVESAVTRLLTDEGRDTAKQLLRDAAVTF